MDTKTRAEVVLATGHRLSVSQGDVTRETADALVSAANNQMLHTAGVAGALAQAGGGSIERESKRIGWVDTGSVAVTGAGRLPARYLIHAVGPRWNEHTPEEAAQLLASCITAALEAARDRECLSIAIPAISAGTFGGPVDRCAQTLIGAAAAWAVAHPASRPRYIRFVLLEAGTAAAFDTALRTLNPSGATPNEEVTRNA